MAWWEGIEEARVLIAPDPAAPSISKGQLLNLQHPKSGNSTSYLSVDGALQEIHWFKQSYGSWFLGDYVCEDGRLYTATPVDPVFLLLPLFAEARMEKGDDPGKFRQLDEILYIDGYPGYQNLLSIAEKSMQVVCDCKNIGSMKFFRLNDSKVLQWLCFKVDQLKQILPSLNRNYAAQDEKDSLADAVCIVGEYLKEEPWLNLLCSKLRVNFQETMDTGSLKTSLETSLVSPSYSQEKSGNDKKTARSGRPCKKTKTETNSKNIKDMFTRASRKGK